MEKKGVLSIRDIELDDTLGDSDCRVQVHTVGICGSDVHYYEVGAIGPFVVKNPMVLGHEASGTVVAVGKRVKHLKVGDRVAMEPGIPRWDSRETLRGLYNVDPDVAFFATPPVHGCLRPSVIHPAALCFKLPDNVSYEEGAMCEPLAVGMYAATKAGIKAGDVAFVAGAGTIGLLTALCALAGGCVAVIVSDPVAERLAIAKQFQGLHPVLSSDASAADALVKRLTDGGGCDVVFECSGAVPAYQQLLQYASPGATAVLVGMPVEKVTLDVVSAQAKEITFQTIFRYRNVYPKVINLLSSKKFNVRPLIAHIFPFEESIQAYERALTRRATDVKLMIRVDSSTPNPTTSKL